MENFIAENARRKLIEFIVYTKKDYTVKWYHELICKKLDSFYKGEIKRLMLFVPPQHGKSEIVSRRFPAYCLGKNPKLNIIVASYSQSLSMQFNRETQRIIDNDLYREIFPDVLLSGSKSDEATKRTASVFETNHFGKLFSVGVGTGLTGHSIDIGIIDDPVKDAIEAYSSTYRDRTWDWYLNVFCTRLHNESKVLLTMTRWHEDDLAGRIISNSKKIGEEWEIFILPAIKENNQNESDIREIGQTLWPEKHSLEKVIGIKNTSMRVFTSLYQQRPAPEEGNKIKTQWIGNFNLYELEKRAINEDTELIWDFTIDGAYTKDRDNDATGLLAYCKAFNNLYVRDTQAVRLEMPELLNYIPSFVTKNGYSNQSRIYIEPKASGLSIVQMLRNKTGLNVISDNPPRASKEQRVDRCTPFIESRRMFVLEYENWIDGYLHELSMFPNGTHDDLVDCTTMAIDKIEGVKKEVEFFGVATI